MGPSQPQPRSARFGLFEVDIEQRILTKGGLRIKLQEQPFQVLAMLLERPGEIVSREDIRKRLWPADTFVEFDDGLNTAIKKLRAALSDSADNPRFIETVPRRGYRFLAPVTTQLSAHQTAPANPRETPRSPFDSKIELTTTQVAGAVHAENVSPIAVDRASAGAETLGKWRLRTLALASFLLTALVLVLLGWEAHRARWSSRGAQKKISLAVLPLEDLSPNHSEEYLSEGLTDELVTDLANIPGLRIISRTSAMQYKGTHKPLPQIARELNVDALVEGTVLRSGDRARVRVQLIDGHTDEHLWAEAYERDVKDILALQSDVARSIAAQIKLELTPQQQARVLAARPVNFDAYSAYLKGRYEWNKRTAESLKKSIAYFQESIEKDASYAQAHEGLAEAYSVLPDYDVMTPGESYPKAKAEALKALELDPMLGEAHATLAVVKEELEWDWLGADGEFQRALELGPGSATIHQWYSEYLLRIGRISEGIDQIRQALELDPASPLMNAELGSVLYSARQYDQAIQQLKKAIEMEPRFPYAHSWLGFAYERKGMRREAIAEFQKAVTLSGGSPFFRAALAYGYGLAGNETEARKISAELSRLSRSPQFYVSPYDFALVHVGLGEREQALKSLEQVVAEHDIASDLLKIEPALDPVRSDPRFDLLVRRVGLAQ
jgi:TolB-like protein/DNA-binding winged helix-turn-helix (wHTH) protein/Tfp pilus assembly protein PilF